MKRTGYLPRVVRTGWVRGVILTLSFALFGCEKKAPPDPAVQEGYRLLAENPKAAYDSLSKARVPTDPHVLLGRGLALERLRRFEEAEKLLLEVRGAGDEQVAWLARARIKVVQGKADEARPLVSQAILADPKNLPALLLEVCLANDDARARTALYNVERWLNLMRYQKVPSTEIPAEYYLAHMSLLRQLGKRTQFESAAEKAKEVKLSGEGGAFALVELAISAGRRDLALKVLRKMNEEKFSADIRTRVAELAHGLGDHSLVEQILETFPEDDPQLFILRAEHAFLARKPQASVALQKALEGTKESSARTRLGPMLAEALLHEGELKRAREEAEKLQKAGPSERGVVLLSRLDLAENNPEACLARLAPLLAQKEAPLPARELAALAHIELGAFKSAAPILDSILREQPGNLRAAQLRIASEIKSGDAKEAVKVAQQLVERSPQDAGLRLLLGEANRKAGGSIAAAQSLRESVAAAPNEARLWLSLVRALEENKAESEALSTLEEAHEKLPLAQVITLALASKFVKMGQAERAAPLYEALNRETTDDVVALNNQAMLYADELENPERAVELAERAYRLSKVPAVVDTLGWALFKRAAPEDLKRALDLLQSVRGKLAGPTATYHLGAVLIATGEPDEGKALLRRALAQPDEFPEAKQAQELLSTTP